MKTICIDVLVLGGAALALLSAWLMLRMKDEYQMMHFMSPPASVSVALITAAIFLQQGFKPESFKALFLVVVLLLMNTVVTHATARAFRIRATHGWRARPGEEFPERPGDEQVSAASERQIPTATKEVE